MRYRTRAFTAAASLFLLLASGGCNSMDIKRVKSSDGESLHAIAMKPESNFGFVARDVLHYGKAYGSSSVADEFAAVATGESTTQVVSKQLSETFDQPTTQSLAQFHAAYLGLVANVTDKDNQKKYWDEIAAIRCEATDVRKEVLARTEYYLVLRAISAVERLREERDYLVRRIDTLQRDSAVMSDLLGRDAQRLIAAQAARAKPIRTSSRNSEKPQPSSQSSTSTADMPQDENTIASVPAKQADDHGNTRESGVSAAPNVEQALESASPASTTYRPDDLAEESMAYQWRLAQLSPEYRGPWLYRSDSWRRAQFRVVSSDLLGKQRALGEVIERLCLAQQREDGLTVHILALLEQRTRKASSSNDASRASHENCDRCRLVREGRLPGVPVERVADRPESGEEIAAK